MGREPRLIAVAGRKGVGKTFTTMKYLRQYVAGDPANRIPGRKVLIFDVNNEYQDVPGIRRIAMKDVPLYSARPYAEIRRVAPFFDDNKKMTLDDMAVVLQWLVQNYHSGLLLIEDINKYVGDNMPGDLIGAICTNRHTGTDIILHYQSMGRLTPKVWQNINVMRMHKQTDTVERHKNKFPDKYEMMKIAERIVDNRYNANDKRFYLFIDFDDEKIHAGVPSEEKERAVYEFISENYSQVIGPMMNMIDENGNKKYTARQAFEAGRKRLLQQYFTDVEIS